MGWAIRVLAAVAALGLAVGEVRAQAQVWIPPQEGLQPVHLDELHIDIDVEGFLARTRMELVFANPNERVLEGEFIFPLTPGQTVSGYELEVEGRLRAGVVVPKQTARVAFEDITRQSVDPGLVELTQGNVFRTRLYPIPANGHKRIVLHFEQVLADEGEWQRYLLPMHFDSPVRKLVVRAQARAADGGARAQPASPDPALAFDRAGDAWMASFERSDVQPRRELSFRIPQPAGTPGWMLARDARDPERTTWVARVPTGLPAGGGLLPAPRHIVVFYDASGSARERDRERELSVLERYLRGLDRVRVDLVAFRDSAEPVRRFDLRNGDARALLDTIRALPLDGGSSYGAIDFGLAARAQLALVIGDGLGNFGEAEPRWPQAHRDGGPVVHVLHAAQRLEPARLDAIARRGGGARIDLLRLAPDAAVAALGRQPWRLLAVEGAEDCAEIAPQALSAVEHTLVIAGRCRGTRTPAPLRLVFGRGDGGPVHRVALPGEPLHAEGGMAASVHRLWAQAHLAELDAQVGPDVDAITALAVRYGVVTRHTSLLVLDRLEDYVRYRIEPPEVELRDRYHALLAAQPKVPDLDQARRARIEALARDWREFRAWHEQSHPWLEAVLLPMAELEHRRWQAVRLDTDEVRALRGRSESLLRQGRELQERWSRAMEDPAGRPPWESQALALVRQLEALHQRRLELAPASETAASAVSGRTDGGRPALDRAEVAGEVTTEPAPLPGAPPPPPGAPVAGAGRAADAVGAPPSPSPADPAAPPDIRVAGWNPDTPWLRALRASSDPYATYLALRGEHGDAPSFFLDCAGYFREEARQPALAVRVLSSIAELGVEDAALTRVLAYRLSQWGLHGLAVGQFERALAQRPEEPQSYRDLALALANLEQPPWQRVVELLWHVASGEWHSRFPGIGLIALHELADVLVRAGPDAGVDTDRLGIPRDLLRPLPVGLRVVLTWDADNTDIDLWVVDPSGERAYYGHNRTTTGGRVSADFTGGYGPEVFTVTRPLPGTYRVQVNYFGDRRQTVTGPVTLQVEFQTGFGTADGRRQAITRRLKSGSQTIDVGGFAVGSD